MFNYHSHRISATVSIIYVRTIYCTFESIITASQLATGLLQRLLLLPYNPSPIHFHLLHIINGILNFLPSPKPS